MMDNPEQSFSSWVCECGQANRNPSFGGTCAKCGAARTGRRSRVNESLFTSTTDEWGTPAWLFDYYNRIHAFTLDVCATPENSKCERFFTKEIDGLAQDWSGDRCWMNPPYGRVISDWMRKAHEESQRGALVVCLVPARVDTGWWHDYAAPHDVTFLRGRVSFEGAPEKGHNAPFPNAIVTMKPCLQEARNARR